MKNRGMMLMAVAALSLLMSVSFAGRVGGSIAATDIVGARSSKYYVETFRGGEVARVAVVGDGDTDLDLYIYDENGNLIDYDDSLSGNCICEWTPKWTGKFTIKVVNRGSVYNHFGIATN